MKSNILIIFEQTREYSTEISRLKFVFYSIDFHRTIELHHDQLTSMYNRNSMKRKRKYLEHIDIYRPSKTRQCIRILIQRLN